MCYMFRHANNIVLVSQPYLHSNYKEIPAIYWMALVCSENTKALISSEVLGILPRICLDGTVGCLRLLMSFCIRNLRSIETI